MNVNVDWCMAFLKVTPPLTQLETRRAYLKLARLYHPDKRGGSTSMFQQLESAYSHLKDREDATFQPCPSDIPTAADSHGVRYAYGSDSDSEGESSCDSDVEEGCQSDDDWHWKWRYV